MDSTRQKKISRLLQKELSEIFQREVPEVTMGSMISITAVRISPDMSVARVYVSIFPNPKIDEVMALIEEHNKQIRHALAQRVGKQMRIIPHLKFFRDDSLDYVENIDRLLKE